MENAVTPIPLPINIPKIIPSDVQLYLFILQFPQFHCGPISQQLCISCHCQGFCKPSMYYGIGIQSFCNTYHSAHGFYPCICKHLQISAQPPSNYAFQASHNVFPNRGSTVFPNTISNVSTSYPGMFSVVTIMISPPNNQHAGNTNATHSCPRQIDPCSIVIRYSGVSDRRCAVSVLSPSRCSSALFRMCANGRSSGRCSLLCGVWV